MGTEPRAHRARQGWIPTQVLYIQGDCRQQTEQEAKWNGAALPIMALFPPSSNKLFPLRESRQLFPISVLSADKLTSNPPPPLSFHLFSHQWSSLPMVLITDHYNTVPQLHTTTCSWETHWKRLCIKCAHCTRVNPCMCMLLESKWQSIMHIAAASVRSGQRSFLQQWLERLMTGQSTEN